MARDGRALAAAYQAAAETHERLGTDQSQRIDVYGAMDRLGLFLAFTPLDHLLGVSLPKSGGVMVTNRRGPGVQRYTAAHELGHCVMHHPGLLLDGEMEVGGHTAIETERQAQLFAAYFLMPPELAHRVADEHGVTANDATPGRLYMAARDMGVSYEAAVRHLANLKRVARDAVERLVSAQGTAKRDAAFGLAPARGTPDVWPVRATGGGSELSVTVGDEVFVRIPENRSTGYRWRPATVEAQPPRHHDTASQSRPGDVLDGLTDGARDDMTVTRALLALPGPLSVALDEYRSPLATRRRVTTRRERRRVAPSGPPLVGVSGDRFLGLVAGDVGETTLELVLARPHEPDTEAVARWPLTLHVVPSPDQQRIEQILATDLSEDPPVAWSSHE